MEYVCETHVRHFLKQSVATFPGTSCLSVKVFETHQLIEFRKQVRKVICSSTVFTDVKHSI